MTTVRGGDTSTGGEPGTNAETLEREAVPGGRWWKAPDLQPR
jgi:hypothetical protein